MMDMQYDCPEEIYHGTFRTAPQVPRPPSGNFPWKTFAPGFSFFLADTFGKIAEQLGDQAARESFQSAVERVLPTVWTSFDPNWREFISCAFAVILENWESDLPAELVARMDVCMRKAVGASIDRRLSDAIPMNTNIELMHMFICHYFGHRYGLEGWKEHADREAGKFYEAFTEFGSFAEFNTTTYYGVDLTVLGLWRKYGKTDDFKRIGREVEQGLWANIALFYNPNLENMSGPFSRAYEMEMREHSSIGVFLYLALGPGYEYLAGINCESEHDPMIALVGAQVPPAVKPALATFQGERLAVKRFREQCERDRPGASMNLCTATAWIEDSLMIGGMSGSRNTNGQMHPATMHWQTGNGDKYYMRLIRRVAGKHWNTHLRGIVFDAHAEKDLLAVDVHFQTNAEIELFFEIAGKHIQDASIAPDLWTMPGLTCRVDADAPAPEINFLRTASRWFTATGPRFPALI
ncbi:hypothetical protein LJK88_49575 [Paenibacillus sp. P26]|nr:hypothetical protein LJK88_49575 [Paenibacillus sp. P26]